MALNNYGGGAQQQAAAQAAGGMDMGAGGMDMGAPRPAGGGGFKFKFGAKAAPSVRASRETSPKPSNVAQPATSTAPMHAAKNQVHRNEVHESPGLHRSPDMHKPGEAPGEGAVGRSLSPEMPGPAVRGSYESNAGQQRAGGAARSEASRMSHESVVSTPGSMPKARRPPGASALDVKKSERLRKLEEELEGMAVTQELQNAYLDPNARNHRPRSAPPLPNL